MGFQTLPTSVNIYDNTSLKILRESGKICKGILDQLLYAAKPGVVTQKIESLAEALIIKEKCKPAFKGHEGYPFCICISVNDTVVHGQPSIYELKPGDMVSIDIGLVHQDHYSDCADTIELESCKYQSLIQTAQDGFFDAFSICQPYKWTGDLGRAINKAALKNNYKVFSAFCGHGIGASLHEAPSIPPMGYPGMGTELVPGMCICIEPVVCFNSSELLTETIGNVLTFKTNNGLPTAHFERQVFITENGPEILTT